MEDQPISEVSISNLPPEILEKILKNLDGRSSVFCKRTSKRLKDQVDYLEKNLVNFWFEHCQNEIPNWAQFDILDNVYPRHWKNQTSVNWQTVYKCWNFWSNNYQTDTQCEPLLPILGLSGITSIKPSGIWLLISTYHGQGKLIAWNLEKSSFFTVYECLGGILSFELVNTGRQLPSKFSKRKTSEYSAELNEFFDTIEHDEIWIELPDCCYVRLVRGFIYKIDRVAQKIRHSYGYEMRLVHELGIAVLYLNKTCDTVKGPDSMKLNLSQSYQDIFHFQRQKVTLINVDGSQIKSDTVSLNSKSDEIMIDPGVFANNDRRTLYSWQNTLFVSFSDKRWLTFKNEESYKDQITPFKKGVITAALFYAGCLFLGNDRGHLLIYKVSQPGDCVALTVYETDCWTICLNPNKLIKIIHIAVVESKHLGMKPTIIVGTSQDIYRITFPENQVKEKLSKCAIKEVRW